MKTAVEWLVQQLWNEGYFPYGVPEDIVKKAKEMEKQQIVEAFIGYDSDTEDNLEVGEQYYNETFKSE
jgi:hypothetical protein